MDACEPRAAKHKTDAEKEPHSVERSIMKWALFSRVCIMMLALLCSFVLEPYDTSAELFLRRKLLVYDDLFENIANRILRPWISWDAIHFISIADSGYVCEFQHAFFPLLPILMSVMKDTVLRPLLAVLPPTSVHAIAGLVITNVSFTVAAVNIFRIAHYVTSDMRDAKIAAILFCFCPASMFLSSIYTESLFAMFSTYGIFYFLKGCGFLSSVFWFFGSLTRSNGILHIGFYAYDALLFCFTASFSTWGLVKKMGRNALYSAILALPYVLHSYNAYVKYCRDGSLSEVRPWCLDMVPNVYAFVQLRYWTVGFLEYYRPHQIPNFFFAFPMALISLCGVYSYIKSDMNRFLALGFKPARNQQGFYRNEMLPLICLWLFMVVYCWFVLNVNILTRFVSYLPCLYIYMAVLVRKYNYGKLLISFIVIFGYVGAVLFACFYPPA